MASIRWIRDVMIDGKAHTFEIMMGTSNISDICYAKIDAQPEIYFQPEMDNRYSVIETGCKLIKQYFEGKEVLNPQGQPFDWK